RPPLEGRGARLRAISYELTVASAQVKSCVLLAALAADGATTVGEPARSRDHTERPLLRLGGVPDRGGGARRRVPPAARGRRSELDADGLPAHPPPHAGHRAGRSGGRD